MIMVRVGVIMLLAAGLCAQVAEAAVRGGVQGASNRVIYAMARGIVRFALAACVLLVVIYLVQLCWQRPRR